MSGWNEHHQTITSTSPNSIGSSLQDDVVVGSLSSRYGKRASCGGYRGQTWKGAGRDLNSGAAAPTSVQDADIRAQLAEG